MNKFLRQFDSSSPEELEQPPPSPLSTVHMLRDYLVIVFSVGVALGAGLNHGMDRFATYQAQSDGQLYVTHAEYQQISLQMPLTKIESILGKGIEIGQSESIVVLEWKNPDNSSITLFFEDGYLVQKAQHELI